jgi:cytochrome c
MNQMPREIVMLNRERAPAGEADQVHFLLSTYRVTTSDGKTRAFWERNLRFMTDSGKDGPERGAPTIMPAGMLGDRAAAIFWSPDEFAKFVESRC